MKINKYEFGHMTNMAAMPVYGKITQTVGWFELKHTVATG